MKILDKIPFTRSQHEAPLFTVLLTFAMLIGIMPLDAASVPPKRGGTVTLAISRDMTVMNPLVDTSSTQRRIRDLMFEPLLGIDPQGNLQARLAESWETSQAASVTSSACARA